MSIASIEARGWVDDDIIALLKVAKAAEQVDEAWNETWPMFREEEIRVPKDWWLSLGACLDALCAVLAKLEAMRP